MRPNLGTTIHSDRSKVSLLQLIGPIAVVYLLAQGFLTGNGLPLLIALPLGFYVAFTWQSRYDLYQNALVVRYFFPRQMVVAIGEIAIVREAKVSVAGDGLLISRTGKSPVFIRPRDAGRMRELIESRLTQPKAADQSKAKEQPDTGGTAPRPPRRRRPAGSTAPRRPRSRSRRFDR